MPQRRRDRYWAPYWVVSIGVASVLMMISADRLRHRSVLVTTNRVAQTAEVRVALTLSHLWLEEYVSGDQIAIRDIFEPLDRARTRVDSLLDGSAAERLPRVDDPTLRARLVSLEAGLRDFETLSRDRVEGFALGVAVGIGSTSDVRYDRLFRRVLAEASELEDIFRDRLVTEQTRSRRLLHLLLLGWTLVVAGATWALVEHERRRRDAEMELERSQAQLLEAQKMEAVGRLASGLAHDLNNYLAAVRGHCELVRLRRDPDDRVAVKMDAVIRIVQKSTALVDRLMAFARRKPSQLDVVSPNRVVEGLDKMIPQLVGNAVEVTLELQPGLWNVRVDISQLEQVLVNLLVNARDAMPDGGTLALSTSNRAGGGDDGGDCVEIAVGDTGCGIAPEIRDRIFEPLFTTKEGGSHSGLGLATVFGIVHQHGGRTEVESEEGVGTTFHIFLPRSTERATIGVDAVLPHPDEELGGEERILVVDDHDDFREATLALLDGLGYDVVAVPTAETALEHLRGGADDGDASLDLAGTDLVVTDVVLPGLSGPELVARLREAGPVRVLFVTGHSPESARAHGVDTDRDLLLAKPFAAAALARRVREVLGEPPS